MKIEFRLRNEPDIFRNKKIVHAINSQYRRPVSDSQKLRKISKRLDIPKEEILLVKGG